MNSCPLFIQIGLRKESQRLRYNEKEFVGADGVDVSNDSIGILKSSKALLKTLYLSTKRITKKWTMPLRNWSQVYNEFVIMYGDRMLVNED